MNTYADVLLIERDDKNADVALKALLKGLPDCNPLRLTCCSEALQYLFDEQSLTREGEKVKLIVTEVNKSGECTVDFINTVKMNLQTQSVHVFSMIEDPGCLELYSDTLKAGSALCLVKSDKFGEKLIREAGYYWQLFG